MGRREDRNAKRLRCRRSGRFSGQNCDSGTVYDAAYFFDLSAAVALPDPKRREGHAARAVALLRRARDAGYFSDPAQVDHLKKGPDLDGLRGRADFQALLGEVAAPRP
jgi:hypothetical protein